MPTEREVYEEIRRNLERIERSTEVLRERYGGEAGEFFAAIGRAAGTTRASLGASRPQLTVIKGGGSDG